MAVADAMRGPGVGLHQRRK